MENSNYFKNLKNDIPSSIVVFFVALPLCLGIALASGAPPFSGIVAGVVGGIVIGALSGSSLGVSGPAAGLAAIVLAAISSLGSFENFLVAVIIGGVLQVILGVLKAGIIGYYFPTTVIKGMLSGIGIIIILKEIPHFFGYDADPQGDWEFIQVDGENTFSEIINAVNHITPGSAIIGIICLFVIIFWDTILAKKHNFFKLIQGPFVAVILGILYVVFFGDHEFWGIASTHLVNVPAPEEFSDWANVITTPNFSAISDTNVWVVGGTIAIVASLETLLSVEATDKLDPQKRVTPTNRELYAQGTGNIISGFIGGLPITQVIVRSSANIQSGGKTKVSAILHGFLLVATVLFIPGILNLIPFSVLAAVLFVIGYKLAKPSLFKQMYKLGWPQFIPFVVTIIVIVYKDLLWGIGVGMVIAIFNVLYKSYKNNLYLHKEENETQSGLVKISLAEEVSFLNKASIKKELDEIPENSQLEIDVRNNVYVDYDIAEIFDDFCRKAKERNIKMKIISKDKEITNHDEFYDFFLSKTYNTKK